MEVRYDKAAVKSLKGLPQKLRISIREAIKGLTLETAERRYKTVAGVQGRQTPIKGW